MTSEQRIASVALVLTTVPSEELGLKIADRLIGERLAACVNVYGPMTSIYRWKGSVERENERQLVIKTTSDCVEAIKDRIHLLHPYELPELLVIAVAGGSDAYLGWVTAEVSPDH